MCHMQIKIRFNSCIECHIDSNLEQNGMHGLPDGHFKINLGNKCPTQMHGLCAVFGGVLRFQQQLSEKINCLHCPMQLEGIPTVHSNELLRPQPINLSCSLRVLGGQPAKHHGPRCQ